MSNSEKKQKKGVVLKTLKYFFPVAWKFSKSYFILSVINVVVAAVLPFVDIIFLPLLVDALCQPVRDVSQILLFAGLMIGLDTVVGLLNSQLTIHLEKYEDKFLNYMSEEISLRCMDIDFALTENKEALDQIQKAREGKDWSGGIHGIARAFFAIIENVIKIIGVITILVLNAPWLLLIIGTLLGVSTLLNARKNRIEVKYFADLAKVDRVWGYVLF